MNNSPICEYDDMPPLRPASPESFELYQTETDYFEYGCYSCEDVFDVPENNYENSDLEWNRPCDAHVLHNHCNNGEMDEEYSPLHYHPTPDSTDDSDRGVDLPQPQVDGTESQLRGALHYHDFIMTNPQHREVAHDCADGSDDDEQYGTVEDHGLAEGVWRRYIRSGLALFNDSQEEINELNKSSSKLT